MVTINLINQKFGRLIVVSQSPSDKNGSRWLCKCDCGNYKVVYSGNLKKEVTQSCGCLHKERASEANVVHGQSSYTSSIEYTVWSNMKRRCHNPNDNAYKNYGGRGIKVCDRWLNSFENFFKDMGERPSPNHSLDRFPNKNGDYEFNNCRWATGKEQQSNRRNNHWLEHNGTIMIQQDWANYFGVSNAAILFHLKTKSFSEIYSYYENKVRV